MNKNQYSTYFAVSFISLLLFGNIITFILWNKLGINGIIAGIVISAILAGFIFCYFSKQKIQNKDGKEQQLSDIIGSVVSLLLIIIFSSIVITISAAVVGYRKNKHITAIAIPLIILFSILSMIAFSVHFCQKS